MWSYVDFSGGAFSASSMYEPDLFGGITQDDFEAANEVDEVREECRNICSLPSAELEGLLVSYRS